MARLDRMPTLRQVAQHGSVLGRQFDYETLRRLASIEESALQSGLARLVESELLYQRGRPPRSRYIFKHALIQDAAYESLLRSKRLQLHQRVAQLLIELQPGVATVNPELLAHHYTGAGEIVLAIEYWRQAGERARAKSANLEAIAYFTRGVEQLEKLPAHEKNGELELTLQVAIGHANIVANGHSASGAEAAYARALDLCT